MFKEPINTARMGHVTLTSSLDTCDLLKLSQWGGEARGWVTTGDSGTASTNREFQEISVLTFAY